MNPTEHETTVAVAAAAKAYYEAEQRRTEAQTGKSGVDWDEMPPMAKNRLLDEFSGPVWAALQALPDRELQIKHLIRETNFQDPRQVEQFLGAVNHGRA